MRNTQSSAFHVCVEHLINSGDTQRIAGILGQGIGKSQQNSSEVLARVSTMNGRQERERGRSCFFQEIKSISKKFRTVKGRFRIMQELSTTLSFISANSFRQKNPHSVTKN